MIEPTTIKLWRAVRVTPPKVPQTLADCEEGRLAVVRHTPGDRTGGPWVLRKLVRGKSRDSIDTELVLGAKDYIFVRYLDDPQPVEQPEPKTFGELRDGQCFRLSPFHNVMWRSGSECLWATPNGKIGSNNPESHETIILIPDIEMVLEEQPTKD